MGKPLVESTLQDFLEPENGQVEKHELHRGEVFAMVGARRVHGLVSRNIAASLKTQLKARPAVCSPTR